MGFYSFFYLTIISLFPLKRKRSFTAHVAFKTKYWEKYEKLNVASSNKYWDGFNLKITGVITNPAFWDAIYQLIPADI